MGKYVFVEPVMFVELADPVLARLPKVGFKTPYEYTLVYS